MKKLHLSLFVLCFSIVSISCINNTKEKFMPGISSNKLTDLNPSFKIKAEHLIEHLEQKGYNVRISQTFRSQERQDFIYNTYQKISNIINIDIRVTETTRSRHSHTRNGKPYACAIDLRPDGFYTIKERASFYITLRDEAVRMGLRSGANFKRKGFVYGRYGLGYDPGHISMYCG